MVTYISHTKILGIYFSSSNRSTLESFLHFPVPPTILPMSDANWGPQDATTHKNTNAMQLPLFASQSMSAFYIDLLGPLH